MAQSGPEGSRETWRGRYTLLEFEWMMRISVKFMSKFRTLAGTEETEVELPQDATVAGLLASLRDLYPGISPLLQQAMIMVNHKIVAPEAALSDGDQVLLLQILGGG